MGTKHNCSSAYKITGLLNHKLFHNSHELQILWVNIKLWFQSTTTERGVRKIYQESDLSKAEGQSMYFKDDASLTLSDISESALATDDEAEAEEEVIDPRMPLVEERMQEHKIA